MARRKGRKGQQGAEADGPFTGSVPQAQATPPAPADTFSAATEAKAFVAKRFRAWFGQKSTRYRTLFIIAVILLLALILQLLVQAGLSFQSLRNDDLVLFIQPEHESVTLPHGENATVAFTLGTSNLNLCEATCEWNITDAGTGEVLVGGSDRFKDGDQRTYAAAVSSRPGETHTPFQFAVTCTNQATSYCKSSASVRHNAAATMVQSVYTAAEQEAYDVLARELPVWQLEASTHTRTLAGIAALDDPRLGSLAAEAADELVGLKARFASIALDLSEADVLAARNLLIAPSTTTANTYRALAAMESRLVVLYSDLLSWQPLADDVLAVASPADRSLLLAAGDEVTVSVAKFSTRSLGLTEETFLAWNDTLTNLSASYVPITLADASRAQQLVFAEQLAACTLKAGPCPVPPVPPANFSTAVASLRRSCADYAELGQYASSAQLAYEQALDPFATEAQLYATYDVPGALADPSFNSTAESLLTLARNGTLGTGNVTLRLAVPLIAGNETAAFFSARCPLSTATAGLPSAPLRATLPAEPGLDVSLPYLSVPQPQCCSLDGCHVCGAQTRYPVVFVHGHSFSARTTPEYSLSTFTTLAFALQQDGLLYLGQAFPREDLSSIPYGEFGGLPGGSSFVITYYYDSYPEEGEQSLISRKSENIETYAIRLKEAIDVVRQKTGSPKVVIVAHSMGGLVSRRYLQLFGEDATASLIMVGTPNHGITRATSTLCPVFGGEKECEDMDAGSVFIAKLNAGRQPSIPVYTIAGRGCDGRDFDGVVDTSSVFLGFADNAVVNGTCPDSAHLLHSTMLDPATHPDVYALVKDLVAQHSLPS